MASIEKVTRAGVVNWLRHNNRCVRNDRNTDIDPARSVQNYSLTPYIEIPRTEHYARREEIRKLEYEHYTALKEQFFCYNRKDVNTLVSVVVTLPKEINDPVTEERFFRGVADFLCARYGNTISITVHKDEGKHYQMKHKNGNIVREWHKGRPHLHYTFIPTVKINHAALAKKRNAVKAMANYEEKISAKERINRKDLLTLHPNMNEYLNRVCGIDCNVNSGITKEQGGNRTVSELKKEFSVSIVRDLEIENERLREKVHTLQISFDKAFHVAELGEKIINEKKEEIKELKKEIEVLHEKQIQLEKEHTLEIPQGWGDMTGWGNEWNGEKSNDREIEIEREIEL